MSSSSVPVRGPGPLSHLTVVELGGLVAAPYATRSLALMGARVIKVEPASGEPGRRAWPVGPIPPDQTTSSLFLHLNANKESVVLDLASPSGQAEVSELIARADLVVENLDTPLEPWNLDDGSLQRLAPSLSVVHISAFGRGGPYARFAHSDLVVQALGGLMANSGEPERPPLRLFGSQAYYLAGAHATVAALAALAKARSTGQFVSVEVIASLCAANIAVPSLTSWAYNRQFAGRRGHGRGVWGIYPCLDGFVSLSVYHTGREWGDFVRMTGIERLTDPAFETVGGRLERTEELESLVLGWMSERTRDELFELGHRFRIAIGPAESLEEVIANPQLASRAFFRTPPGSGVSHVVTGLPARFSRTAWEVSSEAPDLDSHGDWPGPAAAVGTATRSTDPVSPRVDKPLAGLRVLDVTTMLAGPYATRLLADLGAETIKVESVGRYDLTRGPLWRDPRARVYPGGEPGQEPFNRASYYNELNRNKLGISLDLKAPAGHQAFLRLAENCDVVIDNFSAGTMDRLGLGYEALRERNQRVIVVSMPSFGSSGPWRDRVAYGSTIEMLSGMGSLSGYPDGWPMTSGITYGDPVSGVHAAAFVLAAVEERRLSGLGQHIDLSQLECLVSLIGEHITGASLGWSSPERLGNASDPNVPSGAYRCAGEDSWVAIEVVTDLQWAHLNSLHGLQAALARWKTAAAAERRAERNDIDEAISSWTRSQSAYEVMLTLQSVGVPAGVVLDPGGFVSDSHVVASGYLESVAHPAAGKHLMPGAPWRFAGEQNVIRMPAPLFGQHTEVVLREVARFSDEEIRALHDAGVTGSLAKGNEEEE